MLNKWQEAAYNAYDSELLAVSDPPEGPTPEEYMNCGDTLFSFIMSELNDDCDSWDEALRRMNRAQAQLQSVINAIMFGASCE